MYIEQLLNLLTLRHASVRWANCPVLQVGNNAVYHFQKYDIQHCLKNIQNYLF